MQRLSVLQLQNMILAFCSHIITQKEKINSINVFPVPDQDTGSNLAATFEKVKNVLEKESFISMKALAEAVKKTALYSAQGNSGIIFTGFLAGFFDSIQPWTDLDATALYEGFEKGARKARLSIENPKEGTILNVMDEVVKNMKNQVLNDCSIESLLEDSFHVGVKALENTTQQMAVLKESNVVDAGGLAFLILLESFQEYLTGHKLKITAENKNKQIQHNTSTITKNRHEVVFILEESLLDQVQITEMLSPLGDSIDIIDITESIKVHIHTDKPDIVKEIAHSLGNIVYLQHSDMKEEKILELINLPNHNVSK